MFIQSAKMSSIAAMSGQNFCNSIAVLALVFSVASATCRAADAGEQSPAQFQASAFGFGPMTVSLLESARRERPIPGNEPTPLVVRPVGGAGVFAGSTAATTQILIAYQPN